LCQKLDSADEAISCEDSLSTITVGDELFFKQEALTAYYQFIKEAEYFNAPTCTKGWGYKLNL